jgi:hypothetical protein
VITAIVVVLFLIILVTDLRPFWKSTGVKNRIVYCALMAASFCVLFLFTLNIPIPSPTTPIKSLIDALFPGLGK